VIINYFNKRENDFFVNIHTDDADADGTAIVASAISQIGVPYSFTRGS
jgi:hypothetical protein